MKIRLQATCLPNGRVELFLLLIDGEVNGLLNLSQMRVTEFAGDLCSEIRGILRGLFWQRQHETPIFDHRNLQDMVTRAIKADGRRVFATIFEDD